MARGSYAVKNPGLDAYGALIEIDEPQELVTRFIIAQNVRESSQNKPEAVSHEDPFPQPPDTSVIHQEDNGGNEAAQQGSPITKPSSQKPFTHYALIAIAISFLIITATGRFAWHGRRIAPTLLPTIAPILAAPTPLPIAAFVPKIHSTRKHIIKPTSPPPPRAVPTLHPTTQSSLIQHRALIPQRVTVRQAVVASTSPPRAVPTPHPMTLSTPIQDGTILPLRVMVGQSVAASTPLPPRIFSVAATPHTLLRGRVASLCVSASNAHKIFISHIGQWNAAIVCTPVHPTKTTTYVATAINAYGTSTHQYITVFVTRPTPKPTTKPFSSPTPAVSHRRHHRHRHNEPVPHATVASTKR
jgi:hypothetical protein